MKPHSPPFLTLLAGFLFLSGLLNLDYPAKHLLTARLLLPSPDLWLLLTAIAVSSRWPRLLPWTTATAWLLYLLLRLFRLADVAVPIYLNRPFNLYIDSKYLYGLYDLLKTSSAEGDFLRLATIALAVALGGAGVSWFLFRAMAKALCHPWLRRRFLGLSATLTVAALVLGRERVMDGVGRPALVRFGQELHFILQVKERQSTFVGRLTQEARSRGETSAPLTRLAGADLLLFVVESYGRTVFTRPAYRPAMDRVMAGFGKVLAGRDLEVVSTFLTATTYGGSSWLSHATLESGVPIKDDLDYSALLRSPVPPMASFFHRSGYRTISVMPGIRHPFPEGDYFGYEQSYHANDLGYRGPPFGFSPMPDQFVLDRVHRLEFTGRGERPLMVRYILTSSHAAFNIQPPIIEKWETIGDGHLYQGVKPVTYPIVWPDLTNAGPAYLRSLAYEFETLGSYLGRYLPEPSLVVIVGDHQPNLQLTGQDEPWSVPVHVISRTPRLLEPFRRRGYSPGLIPAQPPPHQGLETFLPALLADFSTSP